jgi:hypothetical protein
MVLEQKTCLKMGFSTNNPWKLCNKLQQAQARLLSGLTYHQRYLPTAWESRGGETTPREGSPSPNIKYSVCEGRTL